MINKREGKKGVAYQVVVQGAPVNGKRPHLTGTFDTLRDAKEAEARFRLQLGLGAGRSSGTLGQYLDAWQSGRRTSVALSTWDRQNDFVALVRRRIGSLKLRDVTPGVLEQFYREILATGSSKGGALSARTVLHVHRMLSKFFTDQVRLEVLHQNPASKATTPRVEEPEREDVEPDTLAKVVHAMANNRARLPLLLMAATGLRRGEVCGLKWADLTEDGVLTVQRSRVRLTIDGVRQTITKEPKRRSSIRTVTVPTSLLAMLEEWRRTQAVELVLKGANREDWLFTNLKGHPLVPSTLTTAVKHTAASIGVQLSPHQLRHAHATLLLAAGVPVRAVSERLGHANPTVTMNVYAHLTKGLRDHATEAASDIMSTLVRAPV